MTPAKIWLVWCVRCGSWIDEDSSRIGAERLAENHVGFCANWQEKPKFRLYQYARQPGSTVFVPQSSEEGGSGG